MFAMLTKAVTKLLTDNVKLKTERLHLVHISRHEARLDKLHAFKT